MAAGLRSFLAAQRPGEVSPDPSRPRLSRAYPQTGAGGGSLTAGARALRADTRPGPHARRSSGSRHAAPSPRMRGRPQRGTLRGKASPQHDEYPKGDSEAGGKVRAHLGAPKRQRSGARPGLRDRRARLHGRPRPASPPRAARARVSPAFTAPPQRPETGGLPAGNSIRALTPSRPSSPPSRPTPDRHARPQACRGHAERLTFAARAEHAILHRPSAGSPPSGVRASPPACLRSACGALFSTVTAAHFRSGITPAGVPAAPSQAPCGPSRPPPFSPLRCGMPPAAHAR